MKLYCCLNYFNIEIFTLQRCLDRLRESREKLTARFRKLPSMKNNDVFIEELMKEEWENMRKEQERGLDIEVRLITSLFQDQGGDIFL